MKHTKTGISMLIPVNDWCGRRDSNSHTLRHWNLNPACLPISPLPLTASPPVNDAQHRVLDTYPTRTSKQRNGVGEGARTLDRRNHNPELCQLSYAHHKSKQRIYSEQTRESSLIRIYNHNNGGPNRNGTRTAPPRSSQGVISPGRPL